jgi:osmoprotectant transport system permease protein
VQLLQDVWNYIADNQERFRQATETHLRLSFETLLWAMVIFLPLGVIVSRSQRIGPAILGVVSAFRVVPSLAFIFLAYPILGIGYQTALLALIVLAGPPLVMNTDAGLRSVPPAVIETAYGLGMNRVQVFVQVELPLAAPVIIAGIRSAMVEIIASAAMAAFIGVRSLGLFITSGLALGDNVQLLAGAIPIAMLALLAEGLFTLIERWLTPPTAESR